jgi:hypothetical protein
MMHLCNNQSRATLISFDGCSTRIHTLSSRLGERGACRCTCIAKRGHVVWTPHNATPIIVQIIAKRIAASESALKDMEICSIYNTTMSQEDDFKSAVRAYIDLHDELTRSAKQIRELRKQRELVGETILAWMRSNSVDECQLPDGKLVRKRQKRTESLKKDYVLVELKKVLGGDEGRAAACLNSMFSMRNTVEKEVLTRTVNRGSTLDL